MLNTSILTQTPKNIAARVPSGHIVVSSKWKGSDIIKQLQGSSGVLYEDHLGVVDFYPASTVGVIYLSEADLVAGSSTYKRKLNKLRQCEQLRGIVIAEKTSTSSQYFSDLQTDAVLDLGLVLLPVATHSELVNLLVQLTYTDNHQGSNPFIRKRKLPSADAAVLATVQCIPKLGQVKAKALLEKFKSISGISEASEEELASVVGPSSARQIYQFFNQKPA